MNYWIKAEVGVAYGSPGGIWDTIFVEIPAVAEEQIEAFALKEAKRKLAKDVAGLWLYNYETVEGGEHE